MTHLRRHMLADMQAQNLPQETQDRYIVEVANLAAYYGRSPDHLSVRQIQGLDRRNNEKGSADEGSCAVEAIRFFYTQTLGRQWHVTSERTSIPARRPDGAQPTGPAPARISPLRQQMIDDMTIRGMSPGTQKQYVAACVRFAQYYRKSPEHLGLKHIRLYQLYLVHQRKVAWSTLNIVVCALRFLYGTTLGKDWAIKHIPYAKLGRQLPEVLSLDEVAQFLKPIENIKHRAMLVTAYAVGLRLSEVASLRLIDIDSRRMVIRVKAGKGRKDRYVMLPPDLLALLRLYWATVRPSGNVWLFPGAKPDQHITSGALAKICARMAKLSGLKKKVTLRTLRHYAAFRIMPCGLTGSEFLGSTRDRSSA